MVLRRLFGGAAAPVPTMETTGTPGTPDPQAETQTVRRIVSQLDALPLEQRRFVAGFAYVLGRAAQADLDVSTPEQSLMEQTIRDVGGLTEAQSVLVVEIARNQAELYGATEDFLVTRELTAVTTPEQRERLLRCAFAVGAADRSISTEESAELNEIGKELGFTTAQVDAIRLEHWEQLSSVQAIRRITASGGS